MPAYRYHAPVDPDCPRVEEFNRVLFDDPMTEAMGAPTDDIVEGFERKHRLVCDRCREYGLANAYVVTP